jgi:hypothetical protein
VSLLVLVIITHKLLAIGNWLVITKGLSAWKPYQGQARGYYFLIIMCYDHL